jgi:signal transduction histidine kinase
MNIFRKLRWQLTLSYTIVTVSAILVILLFVGGIAFNQIFIPKNYLDPDQLVYQWLNSLDLSNYKMWSQILSQSPVDLELTQQYLDDSRSIITSSDLFRIGALQFSVSTNASIRVLIIGADGTLLATSVPDDPLFGSAVGLPFDANQVPGLEAPLKAALAGDIEPEHLYTVLEPNHRYVFAGPIFNQRTGNEKKLVGVMAVLFDAVPTQGDIPAHILKIAGRSLVIFLLGVGIMGAIFGAIFAHGIDNRFKRIAATTDLWSEGDFSRYIDDTTGDEISQFAQRLNNMARELQSLLHRRQDMAVSEERNRLARDLHDSAKQQALAASFELGTALTLFERDPQTAKTHLEEADTLVDAVRKELTNLVDELRPQPIEGQDFAEILREHALDWSQRSGIELDIQIEGNDQLSLAIRETLFRITQEALANISRHSSASHTEVFLDNKPDKVTLVIKDDGRGFDTGVTYTGLGLHSMRERSEALGGSFTIESIPDQGTQIRVTLPKEIQ